MTIRFITALGTSTLSEETFYRGLVQHVRNMSLKESLAYFAEETGYKEAQVKAAILAFVDEIKRNAHLGQISYMDGVAYITITCKGAFKGPTGPWVKGANWLELVTVEVKPWKTALEEFKPENQTEGLKPVIDSVLDTVTGQYDEITGTDVFSVGGNNLAPDPEQEDEGVTLVAEDGTRNAAENTYSDIGMVKGKLPAAIPAGKYTLEIATRCGLGSAYEVRVATRKITVK